MEIAENPLLLRALLLQLLTTKTTTLTAATLTAATVTGTATITALTASVWAADDHGCGSCLVCCGSHSAHSAVRQ